MFVMSEFTKNVTNANIHSPQCGKHKYTFGHRNSKLGHFGINRTKNKIFYLIHTCKPQNNLKRDGPGCKICQKNLSILDIVNAFLLFHKNVANAK